MTPHCSILAWRIPWSEPAELRPQDHKGLGTAEHAHTHTELALCHKIHINIVIFVG